MIPTPADAVVGRTRHVQHDNKWAAGISDNYALGVIATKPLASGSQSSPLRTRSQPLLLIQRSTTVEQN